MEARGTVRHPCSHPQLGRQFGKPRFFEGAEWRAGSDDPDGRRRRTPSDDDHIRRRQLEPGG